MGWALAHRKRALSLLEVILAIGILAVAILSLVLLFTSGIRLMTQSSNLTRATEVGREFMETTKSSGFSNLPAGPLAYDGRKNDPVDAATGFPLAPYPVVNQDGRDYHLVVRISPESGTLKRVEVDVYWDGNSKMTLETYIHP